MRPFVAAVAAMLAVSAFPVDHAIPEVPGMPPGGAPRPAPAVRGGSVDPRHYVLRLKETILEAWKRPPGKDRREAGAHVAVDRDGRLTYRIEKPSGDADFDRSIGEAVRRIGPRVAAPPASLLGADNVFRVRIVFRAEGNDPAREAAREEKPFRLVRREGDLVHYEGQVAVAGKFTYSNGEASRMIMGDRVAFFPDDATARKIPREAGDGRAPWFCFRDTRQAKALLGIREAAGEPGACEVEGRAEVVISGYTANRTEGAVNDIADLVRVIRHSPPVVKRAPEGRGGCP